MADRPYSNREIDSLFKHVLDEIHELQNRPFEKDVRESLMRVETEIGQVKIFIEERVQQEREKNKTLFSAKWVERGALALFTLIATSIVIRYWNGFVDFLQK